MQKNTLGIKIILLVMLVITISGVAVFTKYTPTSHPVESSQGDQVHVHGDFRLYLGDERIRFTDEKYQSSAAHTHHVSLHFHDGNDEVIHRHADSVTLTDFFDSIGTTLTNECLTLDTGTTYCTNETSSLLLFVNGTKVPDVSSYIFAEEDRILLYYGDPNNPKLPDYITGVTDLSCVYSGTCPERGTPPTESCGLTCEVAELATESKGLWHTITHFFPAASH